MVMRILYVVCKRICLDFLFFWKVGVWDEIIVKGEGS